MISPRHSFLRGWSRSLLRRSTGRPALTKYGLTTRDKSIFHLARSRNIPVATTLAGGYARRVEDTVRIHANTILAARKWHKKYSMRSLGGHLLRRALGKLEVQPPKRPAITRIERVTILFEPANARTAAQALWCPTAC